MMDIEQDKRMPPAGIKQDENDNNTNTQPEKIEHNESLGMSNSALAATSQDIMDKQDSAPNSIADEPGVSVSKDSPTVSYRERGSVKDVTVTDDNGEQQQVEEESVTDGAQISAENCSDLQDSSGIQVHIMEAEDGNSDDWNSEYNHYKPSAGSIMDSSSFDRIPDTLQRTPSPEELMVMEEIFEPRPSTSKDSGINRIGSPVSGTGSTVSAGQEKEQSPCQESVQPLASAEDRRQRLKFLPRTNQYEKHPLLQIRSESGLSEFEMIMLEHNTRRIGTTADKPLRTYSLDESGQNKSMTTVRLVPRGAHIERSALFEKTASGLSELEQYLLEKERELGESSGASQQVYHANGENRHSISSVRSAADTNTSKTLMFNKADNNSGKTSGQTDNADGSQKTKTKIGKPTDGRSKRPPMQHSKSISEGSLPSQQALQPRRIQYEKHYLLETRDDSGMSELDHFLLEKEREYKEKGKCSSKCTCKNVNCNKCKGASPNLTTKEVDMVTRIEPKTNNKRVHFQRQECIEADRKTSSSSDSAVRSDRPEQQAEAEHPEHATREVEHQQTTMPSDEAAAAVSHNTADTNPDNSQTSNQDDGVTKEVKPTEKLSKTKTKRHKSVCVMS